MGFEGLGKDSHDTDGVTQRGKKGLGFKAYKQLLGNRIPKIGPSG